MRTSSRMETVSIEVLLNEHVANAFCGEPIGSDELFFGEQRELEADSGRRRGGGGGETRALVVHVLLEDERVQQHVAHDEALLRIELQDADDQVDRQRRAPFERFIELNAEHLPLEDVLPLGPVERQPRTEHLVEYDAHRPELVRERVVVFLLVEQLGRCVWVRCATSVSERVLHPAERFAPVGNLC